MTQEHAGPDAEDAAGATLPRSLLDVLEDIYYRTDMEGRIVDASPTFVKLLGWTPAELHGKRLADFYVDPEGRAKFLRELQESGGHVTGYEAPLRHRDGSVVWVSTNAHYRRDGSGKIIGVEGLTRDVTRRRLAEESLRRANRVLTSLTACSRALVRSSTEQQLLEDVCRVVVEDAGYAIAWVGYAQDDPDKTVKAMAVYGADRKEVEGLRISYAEGERGRGIVGSALRTGKYLAIGDLMRDDRAAPWRTRIAGMGIRSGAAFPLNDGERTFGALAIYSSAVDVIDAAEIDLFVDLANNLAYGVLARRAHAALSESEKRYRALSENMIEGILILQDGRFAYVNPTALRMLGYAWSELEGREFAPLIHPDFRALVAERHRRRSAGESLPPRYDIQIVSKDGAKLWVQIANERIDWAGRAAVLTIISDIGERKRAEEEIQRLNVDLESRVARRTAELEDTVQELESFCYTISHDLRAPLRALNGYAKLVLQSEATKLPEESRQYLSRIARNAVHMGALLDDLLDFARLGRVAMREEKQRMGALAADVVTELKPSAGTHVVIGELPDCRGDAALLRLVWRNLIANAIKYSQLRDPAQIEIGWDRASGAYYVRDNGVGFDEKYADKLFKVFSRLHSPSEYEGTGVGLAIVRRIVERHDGRTWAEGTPEGGATFYFTIGR